MPVENVPMVDVHEARRRLDQPSGTPAPILLDVREPHEVVAQRVPGCVLLPTSRFAAGSADLPTDRPILVLCRSGHRSGIATDLLIRRGWPDVTNIAGGIIAWVAAGLPTTSGPLAPGEGDLPGA